MVRAPEREVYQPGQLGTQHLLGAMAVVCLVAGLSASSVRSLPPERGAVVAIHWAVVAAVAFAFYGRGAFKRRRDRRAAGELLLRVLRHPFTELRRQWLAWGLTAAVVIDGVVMSAFILPNVPFPTFKDDMGPYALGFQAVMVEGLLWGGCLDAWAGNIYWLGFHEHGLLTKDRFYPWKGIDRIAWDPAKSPQIAVYGEFYLEMTLDPADHQAVTSVLESIRPRIEPPPLVVG